LRRQGEGLIGVRQGERQQRRQQRHGLGQGHTRRGQRSFQCTQWLGWRRVVGPPQQALQMIDDGGEGALLVRGRPTPLNPGMQLGGDVLFQHLHQAGFANAGLAAEQHHLPHPCGGLVPAPLHEHYLFVPPYQGGQAARRDDVEPGLRPTPVQDPIDLERLGHAFEHPRPERLTHKVALDQAGGRLADHDRIRSRQALESCRNVWRLPQGELLLPPATADLADHHQPGVNAEPHGQAHPMLPLQACIQGPHGLDHAEPATDGPLDRVFMRLGIAKVHQQAIAEVLCNVAVKALDDLGTGGLISPHHDAEVFRIELTASAVESTRSQNRTVSWRRSASGDSGATGVGRISMRGASEAPGCAPSWGADGMVCGDTSVPPVHTNTIPSSSTASR
jgi:hypothetical protein